MNITSLKSFVETCYTHRIKPESISIKNSAAEVISFSTNLTDRVRVVNILNNQQHWRVTREVPYKSLDIVRITITHT